MTQKIVYKLETHPNRNHRPYHNECKTFLRNLYYHNFKNGGHKEIKIGIYCPACNKFYPIKNIEVVQ